MAHGGLWRGMVALLLGSGVLLSGWGAVAEVEILDHTLKGEVEIGGRLSLIHI